MTRIDSIRFGIWAQGVGHLPMLDEILDEYPGVSRATAYRMRDDLREAWGLPREERLYLHPRKAPDLVMA